MFCYKVLKTFLYLTLILNPPQGSSTTGRTEADFQINPVSLDSCRDRFNAITQLQHMKKSWPNVGPTHLVENLALQSA